MSKDSVGDKLERQYENVKDGLKGVAEKLTAEDREPRTDAMAGRKSGARSRATAKTKDVKAKVAKAKEARSKEELYADAKRLGLKGRSKMTKSELEKAIRSSKR